MNNVKFKIIDIKNNIKYRPKGYYDDVISKGVINGEYIEIPFNETIKLLEKYSEKNPIIGLKNDTKIWGPKLWKILHDRTNQYSLDIDAEKRWIKIFISWIPCGICKTHFKETINEIPIDLSTKSNYINWAINAHNRVNKILNKPIFQLE